jgi:hypothetical protein
MVVGCCDAVEDLLVAIIEANGNEALLLLLEVVCFIICFHAAPEVQVRQLNRPSNQH